MLHENGAVDGTESFESVRSPSVMVLIHGLSGCHASPYMVRLTRRFLDLGWIVYRVDMRGCGAGRELARQLSHAGRSEDVQSALDFVAERHPGSPISVVGVSLGGNQLLRWAGRVGSGQDRVPDWLDRIAGIVAIAPPIDLKCCSQNMERLSRRPYNYFFIRTLLNSAPPMVRQQEVFQRAIASGRPRTLFELDDRLTAPLSGFAGADEYYGLSGAASVTAANSIRTLVLAAADDPLVPVDCFRRDDWPQTTELLIVPTGGHAGFLQRGGGSWMDDCIVSWAIRF